jgi:tocopherol O-methyltransferase
LRSPELAEQHIFSSESFMIRPRSSQTPADVAAHYDTLDPFYRELWGEHVHHGYWRTGDETPKDAADALVGLVAERLDLAPGQTVCDIGCG